MPVRTLSALALVAATAAPAEANPCLRRLGKDVSGGLNALVALPSGNALALGHGTAPRRGIADQWLVELDATGALVREVFVTRRGEDKGASLVVLGDGDAVLGGSAAIAGTHGFGPLLVRVDATGKERWARTLKVPDYGEINGLASHPEGGFTLAMLRSKKKGSFQSDAWAARVDASGKTQWEYVVPGAHHTAFLGVAARPDGSTLLVGETAARGVENLDGLLLALGADGTHLWEKTYGGPRQDVLRDITPLADGAHLISGFKQGEGGSQDQDFWVIRIDASGEIVWERTFGGPGYERLVHVVPTADGGALLAGVRQPPEGGNADLWFIRLDGAGAELWQRAYEGPAQEEPNAGLALADGFLFVGAASEDGKSWPFVLRIGADGACVSP